MESPWLSNLSLPHIAALLCLRRIVLGRHDLCYWCLVWLGRLPQFISRFADADGWRAWVEINGWLFDVGGEELNYALALEDVGACVAAGSQLIMDA